MQKQMNKDTASNILIYYATLSQANGAHVRWKFNVIEYDGIPIVLDGGTTNLFL